MDTVSGLLTPPIENKKCYDERRDEKCDDGHDLGFWRSICDEEDFVLTDHTQHVASADVE